MKLFRTDLNRGLSGELFDIPADSLALGNLRVKGDVLSCTLTSKITSHGYHLTGAIKATVEETCDRCLESYFAIHETPLELILTTNEELMNEVNVNVILFPETEEFVDLSVVLHDIIQLEEPLKRICDENCKGLCPKCGTNLNMHPCSCEGDNPDHRWKALKSIS